VAVDELVDRDDLADTAAVSELVSGESRFHVLSTCEHTMLGSGGLR
jgi:hypothetical protein